MATSDKLYIFNIKKNRLPESESMVIPCKVTSGIFCGETFIYMNNNAKINFAMLGKSFFLQNYEKKKYILGII